MQHSYHCNIFKHNIFVIPAPGKFYLRAGVLCTQVRRPESARTGKPGPEGRGTFCADLTGREARKNIASQSYCCSRVLTRGSPGRFAILAIPVFNSRVAPVLNWCSRVRLFPDDPTYQGPGQELHLAQMEAADRLAYLQGQGVTTLICGAMSADLHRCAMKLGLQVILGVAGDIADILEAYRQNQLDRPEFWLPGCRGPRRYPRSLEKRKCRNQSEDQGGKTAMPGSGRGAGGGQGGKSGGGCRRVQGGVGASGPGQGGNVEDFCLCPACGAQTAHQRGIPCIQVTCAQCGKPMVRG